MHVKKGKNNTPAGRLYSISSNIRVKTYNCKAQSAHTHNRERKRIKIRQITLGLSVFPKIELHVEYFNAKSQNVSCFPETQLQNAGVPISKICPWDLSLIYKVPGLGNSIFVIHFYLHPWDLVFSLQKARICQDEAGSRSEA